MVTLFTWKSVMIPKLTHCCGSYFAIRTTSPHPWGEGNPYSELYEGSAQMEAFKLWVTHIGILVYIIKDRWKLQVYENIKFLDLVYYWEKMVYKRVKGWASGWSHSMPLKIQQIPPLTLIVLNHTLVTVWSFYMHLNC